MGELPGILAARSCGSPLPRTLSDKEVDPQQIQHQRPQRRGLLHHVVLRAVRAGARDPRAAAAKDPSRGVRLHGVRAGNPTDLIALAHRLK